MAEDLQRMTKRRLGGILMSEGLVTPEQVTEALEKQKETGKLLGEILIDLGYITEHGLVKTLSMQFQFPFISPQIYSISKETLDLLPIEMLHRYLFIPLDKFGTVLTVAMGGFLEEESLQEIKKITGCDVKIYISPPSQVRKALEQYAPMSADKSKKPAGTTVPIKAAPKAAPATGDKAAVILEEVKSSGKPAPAAAGTGRPAQVAASAAKEEQLITLSPLGTKAQAPKAAPPAAAVPIKIAQETPAAPSPEPARAGSIEGLAGVNWQSLFDEVDKSIRDEVDKKKPTGTAKPPKVYEDDY